MRKCTDENDHSHTGHDEKIATPPAQCTSPRLGRPEDFTEMNPSNTGHGRQNPSVNSKKKSDSENKEEDEEEEDEDEDEEENKEEIATALDSKEVSHVHVDTDACNHSKQRLESEIPPETQNDPESEVTDGCNPPKKAFDKTVLFEDLFEAINIHKEFCGEKEGSKASITKMNKTNTCDGYDFNIDTINNDEYNPLQKESLMLFEAYCIFGFWEFFKNLFCILMEVNKTMYGNNEDVPKIIWTIFH